MGLSADPDHLTLNKFVSVRMHPGAVHKRPPLGQGRSRNELVDRFLFYLLARLPFGVRPGRRTWFSLKRDGAGETGENEQSDNFFEHFGNLCSLQGESSEEDAIRPLKDHESVMGSLPSEVPDLRSDGGHDQAKISFNRRKKANQDYLDLLSREWKAHVRAGRPAPSETCRLETGPRRWLREMLPGQHNSDPDENAQNKPDHETKTGRVLNRPLAEIKNSRRFILVHRSNLHVCPPRTTEVSATGQVQEFPEMELSARAPVFPPEACDNSEHCDPL